MPAWSISPVGNHRRGGSGIWVLLAVCALVLAGCGSSGDASGGVSGSALDGAGRVALQGTDISGLERCDYSGGVDGYLSSVRDISPRNFDSIGAVWANLQAAGASGAYVAVYAETPRACQYWITGPPKGHDHSVMKLASSIVAEFPDQAQAQAGYAADVFSQTKLRGAPLDGVGPEVTARLGANAIIGTEFMADTGATAIQAVWQAGRFNVFLNTRNLSPTEIDAVTAGITLRASVLPAPP